MKSTGRLGFTITATAQAMITAKITVSHDDSDNHYLLLMLRQKNSQFFQTPQKVITTATSGFAVITIKYKHYCNHNQYQVPHLHPQQYYYQNLPCLQRQHHDDSLTRSQKHRDGCSPNLNQIPNTVKVGEDLWIIWCYESSG